MPRSLNTYFPTAVDDDDDSDDFHNIPRRAAMSASTSPTGERRPLRQNSERDSLLRSDSFRHRSYGILTDHRPDTFFRHNSTSGSVRRSRHHSRMNSQAARIGSGARTPAEHAADGGKDHGVGSGYLDQRLWYDQFTSIDWVHDSIKDAIRLRELRARKDVRGRMLAMFDSAQGWILAAVIGCITAAVAYLVDVSEGALFDIKVGFCTARPFRSRKACCADEHTCDRWKTWSQLLGVSETSNESVDYVFYILWCVALSMAACTVTLFSRTVVPSTVSLSTLDENLAADPGKGSPTPNGHCAPLRSRPAMVYYSAAGSGVAEVKVILSGFVLHGYLGLKTLLLKTGALIFAVASGLSLGKEGPYVHIGTCVGNICSRIFAKYRTNDAKKREMLSASASSGVAVAFGAPIGGVLFGLEEVSYYFPPKTLFRTFFCCIASALSLKFLDPYGTGKIVPFEVRYVTDWEIFELALFALLGVLGGLAGALFIKATGIWARSFRRIPIIKKWPMLEVALVAVVTGIVSYWNRYTKLAVTELLFELATPCDDTGVPTDLCPQKEEIPNVVKYLFIAFVVKALLTTITFGLKVPAGIYIPSMVVGGLMGRVVGHIAQYFTLMYPDFFLFTSCSSVPGIEACVTPGVYAMVAAGATMCGVTRLTVTLAVICFELTGSLNHVLPFSIAILCAKWTADAIEPRSIYDLLTDMNDYPFLDNKAHVHVLRDTELGDIVPPVRKNRLIDISKSPLVPARELREKLDYLLMAGELDSGLPIVRNGILVGLIAAPDLEYALDKLDDEDTELCMMSSGPYASEVHDSDDEEEGRTVHDFTMYIDPAPIALDVHSPIDLVYQCFMKLGLRHVCVLSNGKFVGLVHKKLFVKYMKESHK